MKKIALSENKSGLATTEIEFCFEKLLENIAYLLESYFHMHA